MRSSAIGALLNRLFVADNEHHTIPHVFVLFRCFPSLSADAPIKVLGYHSLLLQCCNPAFDL